MTTDLQIPQGPLSKDERIALLIKIEYWLITVGMGLDFIIHPATIPGVIGLLICTCFLVWKMPIQLGMYKFILWLEGLDDKIFPKLGIRKDQPILPPAPNDDD